MSLIDLLSRCEIHSCCHNCCEDSSKCCLAVCWTIFAVSIILLIAFIVCLIVIYRFEKPKSRRNEYIKLYDHYHKLVQDNPNKSMTFTFKDGKVELEFTKTDGTISKGHLTGK